MCKLPGWAARTSSGLSLARCLPRPESPGAERHNIDPNEATCSVGLPLAAAGYFWLGLQPTRAIVRAVAEVTRTWRNVAAGLQAPRAKIECMVSAFEHADLQTALHLPASG